MTLKFQALIAYAAVILITSLTQNVESAPVAPLPVTPIDRPPRVSALMEEDQTAQDGILIFSSDDAKYTPTGFVWPWNNVLTIVSSQTTNNYKVEIPKWDFIVSPLWMPDGSVVFFYGDITTSYKTYSVVHWKVGEASAQPITSGLNWRLVHPSPNGQKLAYVQGGKRTDSSPTSLRTFDFQTGQEQDWNIRNPLLSNISWLSNQKLLFSSVSTESKSLNNVGERKSLSIYELDLLSGKNELWISDATHPVVSPDGKRVAYLSYDPPVENSEVTAESSVTTKTARQASIIVSDVDGKNVTVVKDNVKYLTAMIWFQDSSGFALCESNYVDAWEGIKVKETNIGYFDLISKRFNRSGKFRYLAPPGTELFADTILWQPLRVSEDKTTLVSQFTKIGTNRRSEEILQGFNLHTGATTALLKFKSGRGMDWKEQK